MATQEQIASASDARGFLSQLEEEVWVECGKVSANNNNSSLTQARPCLTQPYPSLTQARSPYITTNPPSLTQTQTRPSLTQSRPPYITTNPARAHRARAVLRSRRFLRHRPALRVLLFSRWINSADRKLRKAAYPHLFLIPSSVDIHSRVRRVDAREVLRRAQTGRGTLRRASEARHARCQAAPHFALRHGMASHHDTSCLT